MNFQNILKLEYNNTLILINDELAIINLKRTQNSFYFQLVEIAKMQFFTSIRDSNIANIIKNIFNLFYNVTIDVLSFDIDITRHKFFNIFSIIDFQNLDQLSTIKLYE